MPWNRTQRDWPNFRQDASALAALEQQFLLSSGEVIGAVRHINPEQRDQLRIELLSDQDERIEGETLDRLSVQSAQVPGEMHRFISWFNRSAPTGNRRLGRALAEKSLAQSLGQPSLTLLSFAIEQSRKTYYAQLEQHQGVGSGWGRNDTLR